MSPDRIERIAQPGQGAHWPICQCIGLVESPRISTIKISELASLLHGSLGTNFLDICTYRLDECTSCNHDRVDFRFFEMSVVVDVRIAITIAEEVDLASGL